MKAIWKGIMEMTNNMTKYKDVDYYEFYFECKMCNHRFKYLKEAVEHIDSWRGLHNIAITLGHTIAESDAEKQK